MAQTAQGSGRIKSLEVLKKMCGLGTLGHGLVVTMVGHEHLKGFF